MYEPETKWSFPDAFQRTRLVAPVHPHLIVDIGVCFRRWSHHKSASCMWESLKVVESHRPGGGVIENVMGFCIHSHSEKSGLQVCEEKLSALGYAMHVETMDLADQMAASRPRIKACDSTRI